MQDADKAYLAEHYYDFFTIALSMMRDAEEARDAVQEALAITMSKPFVRDVHAYCCRVVRNCCMNRIREHYVVSEPPLDLKSEEPNTAQERRIALMNKMKSRLPRESIMLLDMHYEQALTIDEMAVVLGKSRPWIKKRLCLILKRLREEILNEELKNKE